LDAEQPRRYLDHPATSWPKPAPVIEAVVHALRDVGAAAGRGTSRASREADGIRAAARSAAARIVGAVDPQRVALPGGATLALNMAIHGFVEPGWNVIATAADHNATLRPLHALRHRGIIELTIVPVDGMGRVDPDEIAAAWRPATVFVAVSHASNVTGVGQDVGAIAAVAHDRGGLLLLDAAQTLGLVPFVAAGCGADIVAAPAHKWLCGVGGTAILWARPGIDVDPLVQGGTGSRSDSLEMPEAFADRLEPGTPDVPALAALTAAVDWLEAQTIAAVGDRCRRLAVACAVRLAAFDGVRVIAAPEAAPIVSFTVEGYDPAEVATLLEQVAGVQVRSGHHCAACVHEHLGTTRGGTVRASFGPFNTEDDVDAIVGAVETITAAGA